MSPTLKSSKNRPSHPGTTVIERSFRLRRVGRTATSHRLASDGGAPAPRRPAARTTSHRLASDGGPQPRDVLRLALPHALAAEAALPAPGDFLVVDVVGDLAP